MTLIKCYNKNVRENIYLSSIERGGFTMAKKILWLSRHDMTEEQLKDLRRIYGDDLVLKQVDATVASWKDVVAFGEDCDILAVVLPPAILSDLTNVRNNSKPVIRAKAERIDTGKTSKNPVTGKQETVYEFRHLCWERVLKVEVVTEKL